MASVFDLLEKIRARPGLYLGSDQTQRSLQLANLEQLLSGYCLALQEHGIREPVSDFNREFGAYLWKTREWGASCGPVAAIREAAVSDEDAWRVFWVLIDEFRMVVEAR